MRVLVTRPAAEAASWVDGLRGRGFDAIALPLIAIAPIEDAQPLDACWTQLAAQAAVMFVSVNAVHGFFARRLAHAAWPAATRAWATGMGTHDALVAAGVPPTCIDMPDRDTPQFDSEALWRRVSGQVNAGGRVLIVRGADVSDRAAGRDWLATQLRGLGAQVQEVAAYRRRVPAFDEAAQALALDAAAVWIFSSTQAVAHLRAWLPDADWSSVRAVATHPRIAQAARDALFGVVRESRPALADVARTLESFR